MWGHIGHFQDFDFICKGEGEPSEGLEEQGYMICLLLSYHDGREETGTLGLRLERETS